MPEDTAIQTRQEVIDLRSVNWSHGMFLTPDHFLRQERYFESCLLWMLRYSHSAFGLVGGGPRAESDERGAARFDPVVDVEDDEQELRIAVSQCRGLTPGGEIVDIHPGRPLRASFTKKELEGTLEAGVYIVAHPGDKEVDQSLADPINEEIPAARRMRYQLKLDVRADEAPWSLLAAKLRRSDSGMRFEKASGYIPPCAFMLGHSELMIAHSRIRDEVESIADRFGVLHRAIVDFIAIARSRVSVEIDQERLAFVDRMVLAMEECAYEILDPRQSPRRFFQQLTRLIRSSALFLNLSPPTRQYFKDLAEMSEVEFQSLLEQGEDAFLIPREWTVHEDLGHEVQGVRESLARLGRLCDALQGRYLDYRISPVLDNLDFKFDFSSGDPVLFKTVARPSRPQAHGQDFTFVFDNLRLDARENYRVVMLGREAKFPLGQKVTVELRINPGSGYQSPPQYLDAECALEEQRNFAFDFKAPSDVNSIGDLRVTLRNSHPVKSGMLYVRKRLRSGLARSLGTIAPGLPQGRSLQPHAASPAPSPQMPSPPRPAPSTPVPPVVSPPIRVREEEPAKRRLRPPDEPYPSSAGSPSPEPPLADRDDPSRPRRSRLRRIDPED